VTGDFALLAMASRGAGARTSCLESHCDEIPRAALDSFRRRT
jgi:hypothetical protein